MKTAISVRDDDFERFERLAAEHGMNRSEFYRRAGLRFADALEDVAGLTRIAEEALARASAEPDLFVRENERRLGEGTHW